MHVEKKFVAGLEVLKKTEVCKNIFVITKKKT